MRGLQDRQGHGKCPTSGATGYTVIKTPVSKGKGKTAYRASAANSAALPSLSGTSHVQLKLKVQKQSWRALRRAHPRGAPMPLKLWSLCNLISSALEPLQSEESLKAIPEVERESEREDTQAENYQ